nr:hypothetical protein [Tanacetum cinerariifolium]
KDLSDWDPQYTTGNVLVRGVLIPDAFLTEEIRATYDFKEYEMAFGNEEIEKMVEGDEDKESYASEFADSVQNDDVDDFGTKIESGSHKEHPKNVTDEDEVVKKEKNDEQIEKEKKDKDIKKEKNIDDVEKTDEVVKEKDVDVATGSMEFRK